MSISHSVVSPSGDIQLDIEYDFKNAYCQLGNTVDQWPAQNYNARLQILVNGTPAYGPERPVVFEHGRWLPTFTGTICSTNTTYTIQLTACFGYAASQSYTVILTPEDCAQAYPQCTAGTSLGPGGVPIGFEAGSPSRTTASPVRREAPVAGPLAPTFNYNGGNPAKGGAGRSWFFGYGETLVANGTSKAVWTDERGLRTTFAGNDAAGYQASDPADAVGAVVKVGTDYELRTPDGVRRTFVGGSGSKGFWRQTLDRWGNGAQGNTTSTSPPTNVSELIGGLTTGRALTLAYDGAKRVTSIIDVNGGTTQFGYDSSGRLVTICTADQTCPAANPWRTFEYDAVTDRLTKVTDAMGGILRMFHYTSGELDQTWIGATTYASGKERTQYVRSGSTLTVKREKGDGSTVDTAYTLSAVGGLWRVAAISGACPECGDENSSRVFYTNGRLQTRTNGNGKTTSFTYDTDGNALQMVEDTTGLARTTTYTYAVAAELPSIWPTTTKDFWKMKTDPSGVKPGSNVVTTRTWAGTGNLELSETVNGFLASTGSAIPRTTKTAHDSSGRVVSIDGPRLSPVTDVTTFIYYLGTDPLNNRYRLKQTTPPDSTLTKYEYHPLGGISKLTRDKGTGTADTVTEYTYNAVGRRTNETVKMTPATTELDLVTTSVYDAVGRLASTEIKEGLTPLTKTKFVYEIGTDRLLTRTNPDGRFGSESGERTKYTYDDRGNVTGETRGYFNGVGTTTEYDVTRVYDGLCRVKKQTFPADAATMRYDYDCVGNLTGIADSNHTGANPDTALANLIYAYDALNRLTSLTRTATTNGNDLTTYGYDLRDQLTRVTDPNGAMTTYVVDDFGALRQQFTPLAGGGVADETDYVYDEANDLTSTTETGIRATNRTYDAAGRLTTITYVSGGPPGTVTYTYDTVCLPDPVTTKTFGQGRLCKVTDGTATTEYAYDRRGLVVKERVTLVATPGTKVYDLTYQYDAAGRRKSVAYPSGDVVIGSFDVNNRPQDLTYTPFGGSPSPLVTKITHQVNGPIRSFRTSGNLQEARTFDTRFRRLTQRTFNLSTNPMTLLMGWQYGDGRTSSLAYDKESNLKAVNDVTPGISPPSDRTFGYDLDRYFLKTSTGPYGSSFASQTLDWIYDKNGNRTTETRAGSPTTYTYENDGATPTPHSNGVIATLTPGGTVNHLNSGDLNLDEQLIQHSYDALGRLIEASSTSGCATFPARNVLKRDSVGHRVIRQVYQCNLSALSKTEYLVYGSDGNLYYREVFNGSSSLTDREGYVYLEGEPVAILRTFGSPSGNFFLHNDHLGRPLAMTGSDGFLKWKGEFEPFGKTLAPRTKTTTLEPAIRFPGQWEYSDSENVTQTGSTGVLGKINALEDNWNRTYATRWGRYTQPDPLGVGGDPHPYLYASANPLTRSDRTGLLNIVNCGNAMPIIHNAFRQAGQGVGNCLLCSPQRQRLIGALVNLTIECSADTEGACATEKAGHVLINWHVIVGHVRGLLPGTCPCLSALIAHEAAHAAFQPRGNDEYEGIAERIENRCFPNCATPPTPTDQMVLP